MNVKLIPLKMFKIEGRGSQLECLRQVGQEWNGMIELRTVDDAVLVLSRDPSSIGDTMAEIFGTGVEWTVMKVSPRLAEFFVDHKVADAGGPAVANPGQASPADLIESDYYTLKNSGNAIFVKEAEFFKFQGGLQEEWGRKWKKVRATSIEHARELGAKVWADA